MSLVFPYQSVPIFGRVPPTLPPGATHRHRPLAPVWVANPVTKVKRRYALAIFDTGSDDSIFPIRAISLIGLRPDQLLDSGYQVRWQGSVWPIQFGDVELELTNGGTVYRWPARI